MCKDIVVAVVILRFHLSLRGGKFSLRHCTRAKLTSGRTLDGNVLYVLDLVPRSDRLQVSQRVNNKAPAQTHFFPIASQYTLLHYFLFVA